MKIYCRILLIFFPIYLSSKNVFGSNVCSKALTIWNQSILSSYSQNLLKKEKLLFENQSIPRVLIESVENLGIVDENFFLDSKRNEKLIDDQGFPVYRRPKPNTDAETIMKNEPTLFSQLNYSWRFLNKENGKIENIPSSFKIQDGLDRDWTIAPTEDQYSLAFESCLKQLLYIHGLVLVSVVPFSIP